MDPTEGKDGFCFTAGLKAAVTGAGTTHACLASRRPAPKVVAGISLGAVNAAAMQRAYREIAEAEADPKKTEAEQESARWAWFRRYVDALSADPFQLLWKDVPDQSDFFADMIPIADTSVPKDLVHEEADARRHLYLKVKLGRWLSQLPIRVRLVAASLVNYVRLREQYPLPQRVASFVKLFANGLWLSFLLTWRVGISPQFFPEHEFPKKTKEGDAAWVAGTVRSSRVPVLGWINLLTATAAVIALVAIRAHDLVVHPPPSVLEAWKRLRWPLIALPLVILLVRFTIRYREDLKRWGVVRLLAPIAGGAAHAFSALNALAALALVVSGAAIAHAAAHPEAASPGMNSLWVVALKFIYVANLGFAAATVLPSVRRGLVAAGILHLWPRPLFGWPTFVAAWTNLVSFAATAVLFTWFIVAAWPHHDVRRGIAFAIEAVLLTLGMLIFPLLVVGLLVPIGRYMRRSSVVKVKGRRWVGWMLSVALGTVLFGAASVLFALPEAWLSALLENSRAGFATEYHTWWHLFILSTFALMTTWFVAVATLSQPVPMRWFTHELLQNLGLRNSLIPDHHLTLALRQLFGRPAERANDPASDPTVDGGAGYPAALIVAAPLQTLYKDGEPRPADQLWAGHGTSICHALRCALSVPPIFAPVKILGPDLESWLTRKVLNDPKNLGQFENGIDLVDGSVIRQNPLPALFGFLRRKDLAAEMARSNSRDRPAIHVVYGVPIDHQPEHPDGSAAIKNTIVDVGLASLRLSQRRDTQLEVMQTNVVARLETHTPKREEASPTYPLFADEIAPASDLVFDSEINPSRESILEGMAAGCRRTLQKLYGPELRVYKGHRKPEGHVACGAFLRFIRPGESINVETPGLPEVCGHCTAGLVPPAEQSAHSTASIETFLSEPAALCREHPQLVRTDRPRIVFIASGGVFRGAFHIGMLAALKEARLKPDLIVGASVGTLMGGALGRMFCDEPAHTLERLVQVFMEVDARVALTQTLKSAARELGLRGRSIKLSPRRIRRLVRRGGRGDPGFAATGAPSALIDGISDLFMIPHGQTRRIAARFVAGHTGDAADLFISQLRTETIRRLQIERAIIGSSLIEQVAAELLTDGTVSGRVRRQPFQDSKRIAFYGTTTNLMTQSAVLLGGTARFPGHDFDFVEAALASSAFPMVFPPREESLVFPGQGRSDVLFADGGMFDNLPFFPAIELLAHCQFGQRLDVSKDLTVGEFLASRLEAPDLLIAGALDPTPETDEEALGTYESINAVRRRAGQLKKNVKIRSFELASRRVYGQLMSLQAAPPRWMAKTDVHFVDKVVNAGVMPVFPSSREHLNGTFSFCASTGLKRARVQKSIADGCFQTLRTLADQQAARQHPDLATDQALLTTRSIAALTNARTEPIAVIAMTPTAEKYTGPGRACPYFLKDAKPFACPFTVRAVAGDGEPPGEMKDIHTICSNDEAHRRARPRSDSMPRSAPRNLIALSDGTGNSAAKLFKTNVWRLYDALDLTTADQIALYDDGVGTAAFKPLAILGGAFGYGLKRNVLDLYMFLCRNYREGDRIFVFGFSRGAFTARLVAGLVAREGLITGVRDDEELKRLACWAYRKYRKDRYRDTFGVRMLRGLRNRLLEVVQWRKPTYESVTKARPDIKMLGVFDTVAAYGLPMDELTRGWDRWIWPMLPSQRRLNEKIKRACHALAIDDERQTFFPLLWDEHEEPRNATSTRLEDERLSQVWFAGSHSNVGGGYPDDSLAFGPLCWMAREAEALGLRFQKNLLLRDGDRIPTAWTERSGPWAPMNDSRRGAGAYYRYHPRPIARLCDDTFNKVKVARPKIHESVFKRVDDGRDGYAPFSLPTEYAVVGGDGRILSGDGDTRPPAPAPNPYEHSTQAAGRAHRQETAWNVVWHRRVVYFATVAVTLLVLAKPLIPWFNDAAPIVDETAPLKAVVDVVGTFVPGFADGWLDHYRKHPTQLVVGGLIIGFLMRRSTRLKRRIGSRMGQVWQAQGLEPKKVPPAADPKTWVYKLRTSKVYVAFFRFLSRRLWPTLFGVGMLIALVVVLPVRVGFAWASRAGWLCEASQQAAGTGSMEFAFHPSAICHVTNLKVEKGAKYLVDIALPAPCEAGSREEGRHIGVWHDASVVVESPAGFLSSEGIPFVIGVPFRRLLGQPWFVPIASIGTALPERHPLASKDGRNAFIAGRPGPLTMYVNDAAVPIAAFADTGSRFCYGWDCLYRNNGGGPARVRVTRLAADEPAPDLPPVKPFTCEEQKAMAAKR